MVKGGGFFFEGEPSIREREEGKRAERIVAKGGGSECFLFARGRKEYEEGKESFSLSRV